MAATAEEKNSGRVKKNYKKKKSVTKNCFALPSVSKSDSRPSPRYLNHCQIMIPRQRTCKCFQTHDTPHIIKYFIGSKIVLGMNNDSVLSTKLEISSFTFSIFSFCRSPYIIIFLLFILSALMNKIICIFVIVSLIKFSIESQTSPVFRVFDIAAAIFIPFI